MDGSAFKMHKELLELHSENTYFAKDSFDIYKYEKIKSLIFGFTLSVKRKFAIIPIPPIENFNQNILTGCVKDYYRQIEFYFKDYDFKPGHLRCIITSDESFVNSLIYEFRRLQSEADRLK